MNDKLIKQIKELKGVKTVESMSDKVVVTFEATKHEAIKIQTKEQSNFIIERSSDNRPEVFERCPNDIYIEINSMNGWWQFSEKYSHKYNIISFTQYLNDYNLQDEWEKYLIGEAKERYPVGTVSAWLKEAVTSCGKFSVTDNKIYHDSGYGAYYKDGKWAEIIPDELDLVKGGIYRCDIGRGLTITFRHKNNSTEGDGWSNYYSFLADKSFYLNGSCVHTTCGRKIVEISTKQKKKYIRTEQKNGYFHELNIKK